MRPVPPVAARQLGVFTAEQARSAGWTSHALRHSAEVGALLRLRVGVYAVAPEADSTPLELLRLRAAALSVAHARVPVSHGAAAAVLGLRLLSTPELVCGTYPRGFRGTVPGAHMHRAMLFPGHVVRTGRILSTSPARTVCDVAREHGADAGIVTADSALRSRLTTREAVSAVLDESRGWPGARAAATIAGLADPRSESALESISRLRMAQAGLPRPEPQVRIHSLDGRFCGRVDFYWDEFGVVGEADGLAKYDSAPTSLREEKVRQGRMEELGLMFVRWGWADCSAFEAVAAQLRSAFARGLRPDRAPRSWRAVPTAW